MILKCEMDVQSIDMMSSSWTRRSMDTTQKIYCSKSEVFDTIVNERLQLPHAGQMKTWVAI